MTQSNLNQAGLEAAYATFFNAHPQRDIRGVIKAAISAYLECVGDGWQPIENAPRDGTRILSCRPDFKDRPLIYAIVAYKDGEWHQQALMGGSLGVGYYPTHWQPLPNPPTTGDSR